MKTRLLTWTTAITLLAVLAIPVRLAAQKQHTRYKATDLGTFGGPNSWPNGLPEQPPFGIGAQILNNQGVVVGAADTPTPDPAAPNFCFQPDCFISHAFQWHNGILTDLGTLAAGWSSATTWISDSGLIAGISENGVIDPLIPGLPEFRAVLWTNGQIVNLGTLGGNESIASAVNNAGQVVGFAANTIADPYSGWGTQVRAFLWQKGVMQDLGSLGGPDALANTVNDRGQVVGWSYKNSTPNPVTGIPTQDPFLWENGKMIDLGTLGGSVGFATAINNRGQVVGQSNLAGDLSWHPFLWDRGVLTDLGTFYQGPPQYASQNQFATPNWINDAGEIVGWATSQVQSSVAIWKNGSLTNAGTVAGDFCAGANSVNATGQAVGGSGQCIGAEVHAVLWEHGGPIVDLNTLIHSGSGVRLTDALCINDRGEIAVAGLLPNGNQHLFLLTPCAEGDVTCANSAPTATTQTSPALAAQSRPIATGRSMLDRLRARRLPGRPSLSPTSGTTK